jgi:superoxide reductase
MISQLMKSADWKAEKHVPVITLPGGFKPGEPVEVEVTVGKEIPHPNTIDHHIAWIALYYVAGGSQLPVELARAEFCGHGPSVFTEPVLKTIVRFPTPPPSHTSTLHAVAYCNLHGLWESEVAI